jgi:hypothetical protein
MILRLQYLEILCSTERVRPETALSKISALSPKRRQMSA